MKEFFFKLLKKGEGQLVKYVSIEIKLFWLLIFCAALFIGGLIVGVCL